VRVRPLLALAIALTVPLLVPSAAAAERICAFAVPTAMTSKIFSGTARSGQVFRFKVAQDSVLDDGTKIPAETIGYGIISTASAAGRHNHDGSIGLEPRYLLVPKPKGGSTRVEVTMNPNLPVVWTPAEPLLNKAASHVPLPIPGLIMTGVNEVRWGRNITLGPGFSFSVIFVDDLSRGPVC
jgi:hypothetical protein